MPEQIKYDLSFSIVPGPPVSKKDLFDVAYLCKGSAVLAPGETRELVVPVCFSGQLKLVAITADQYGDKLTYKKGEEDDAWQLTMPVFLIGAGAASLLGSNLPETLIITNQLDKAATVTIYVGWDPTSGKEETAEHKDSGTDEEKEPPKMPEKPSAPSAEAAGEETPVSSGSYRPN